MKIFNRHCYSKYNLSHTLNNSVPAILHGFRRTLEYASCLPLSWFWRGFNNNQLLYRNLLHVCVKFTCKLLTCSEIPQLELYTLINNMKKETFAKRYKNNKYTRKGLLVSIINLFFARLTQQVYIQ